MGIHSAKRWGKTATILLLLSVPLFSRERSGELDSIRHFLQDNTRKIVLKNGLTLILSKRSYAPVVSLYIKFRAGGADETEASAGIAHMLEHMLFKGTPNIGTKNFQKEKKYLELTQQWAVRLDHYRRQKERAEADGDEAARKEADEQIQIWQRRLKSINGLAHRFTIPDEDSKIYSMNGQQGYNAYTSKDLTNYQIELPSNRIEIWARLESDRIKNSVLREFYTERDVVAEERRMRIENDPHNLMLEQFTEQIYGDHPYGRSLIGSMKSISYLNHHQAEEFYHAHYAPNNTVIAIVGDIDFEQTEAIVRKYFGTLEPHTVPKTRATPPDPAKAVHIELKAKGSPLLYLAWLKPAMPDPDDLALDVLSQILAGGNDSRLFQNLVVRDRIASAVEIYTTYPGERYTNLFFVMAVPAPGKGYDELQSAIRSEIETICRDGVSREELDRVKRKMEAEFIYSLRNNSTLADRLSYYQTIAGDYTYIADYLENLSRITEEKIRQAAIRHLQNKPMHTAKIVSE